MAANNLNILCRDPKFISKTADADELFDRHLSYYLPGRALNAEVKCAGKPCVVSTRRAQEPEREETSMLGQVSTIPSVHPMMLCYACNQTFHVVCVKLNLEQVRNVQIPWRCTECITFEDNDMAVDFYKSGAWKSGLADRRKKLFKENAVKAKPTLLDPQSEDEFEEGDLESIATHFKNQEKGTATEVVPLEIFKKQQEEFVLLMEKTKSTFEENTELKRRLEDMEKNMEKLLGMKATKADEETSMKGQRNGDVFQSDTHSNLASSTMCNPGVLTVPDWLNPRVGADINSGTVTIDDEEEANLTKGIDLSKLNNSERVLLQQAKAQHQSTLALRDMSRHTSLESRRKALPKITHFSGDPREWIRFKRDVKRYQEVGEFEDALMKLHILDALRGVALERVQESIDTDPLEKTMRTLEETFGEVSRVIDRCGEEILAVHLSKEVYRDDITRVLTKIQAYFSACNYGGVDRANTNHLAKHIFSQLNMQFKHMFRHHMRSLHPNEPNKLMDLESMQSFLEDLVKDLEDKKLEEKKKSSTVLFTSSAPGPVKASSGDDYQYTIHDLSTSKILGYNMNLVNQLRKHCKCCGSNSHFTVECKDYKMMGRNQKIKLLSEKGLCRNCMLTSNHRADNCNVKPSCGFRNGNSRCTARHHITLHLALSGGNFNNARMNRPRRRNTNRNMDRARNIANRNQGVQNSTNTAASAANSGSSRPIEPQNSREVIAQAPGISMLRERVNQSNFNAQQRAANSSAPTMEYVPNNPRQNHHISGNFAHTVKVFKNRFIGREGHVIGYSIGDSAAEITLVSKKLAKLLNLQGDECTIELQWSDSTRRAVPAQRVNLEVQGLLKSSKKLMLRNCYVVEDLELPARTLDMDKLKEQFPYLRPVKYESYFEAAPAVLIGSPHASVFESIGHLYEGGEGNPVGLLAKLGWCVYGGSSEEHNLDSSTVHAIAMESTLALTNAELLDSFVYFNSVENIGIRDISNPYTEDDFKALDMMRNEMTLLPDGAIELPLVWNCENGEMPLLPNNFRMVYSRQLAHERKLLRNPILHEAYNRNFKELVDENYVRAANHEDLNTDWTNVWYLPMTLVENANKVPVKYRNVFDASAKYLGTSLNEKLLKGPDLLIDLVAPLLRMRMHRVAFTADIKSMYMRMKIAPRDQQCQRVLFRERPEDEMKVFIVTSMLFGPNCSPFQSQFVKNELASAWFDTYPEASETVRKFMYMDDVLTSEPTVEKASHIAKQCIEMFDSINWKLVSFQSNDAELLRSLPEKNVRRELIPLLEGAAESLTTKVLGCMWDPGNDSFVFSFDKNLFIKIVKENKHKPTKRDQCSTIARIFDVLGLISHFTIRGRILLQRSWAAGLDWDDTISEEDYKLWLEWLTEIEDIAQINIPRRLSSCDNLMDADSITLHIFCDAGVEAYAAVAYLVTQKGSLTTSNIVLAKAKVTPIRYKSKTKVCEIPRLELFAALIAARLGDTITRCYEDVNFSRFFWSDSEVVLKWLNNRNIKLNKYAIAPIEEILEKTEASEWQYVSTHLNVADIATKLRKFDFADSQSIWFTGPEFIVLERENWPVMKKPKVTALPENEAVQILSTNIVEPPYLSEILIPHTDNPVTAEFKLDKFKASVHSTYIKLLRAVARGLKMYYARFLDTCKSKRLENLAKQIHPENTKFTALSALDLERADLYLTRRAQKESFAEDYAALQAGKPVLSPELKQLNVFLDNNAVIRINSRVALDLKTYPQRFAPVLPRENAFTRILLWHTHMEFKHVCLESQIAAIRSKYWVSRLRTGLKSVKANCNLCKLLRARPYAPLMAPLPSFRVDPNRFPFQTTGLDCLGPFKIMPASYDCDEISDSEPEPRKMYVLIFACMLTRFIQLFILESLKPVDVLEAIVSFWNSNGPIQTLVSDNGRNFTSAAKYLLHEKTNTLKELHTNFPHLATQLAERYRIDWKFIPAHSPWMGGCYERLIKEVKRSIASSIETRHISKTQFNIALQDACHRINCRPLTHNAVEAEDEPVLTPHHLAKGRAGWPYLPGLQTNQAPINDRSFYNRGRYLADMIMQKFTLFYLPVLTKRVKWCKDTAPLKVGDLVLLIEPNNTRNEWKRGRVVKIYKGNDRRIRVADVMMPDQKIKKARSVQRLARIEISTNAM